jgi:hypothetical protein
MDINTKVSPLVQSDGMIQEVGRIAKALSNEKARVVETGNRPESGRAGQIHFNTETGVLSLYSPTLGWVVK